MICLLCGVRKFTPLNAHTLSKSPARAAAVNSFTSSGDGLGMKANITTSSSMPGCTVAVSSKHLPSRSSLCRKRGGKPYTLIETPCQGPHVGDLLQRGCQLLSRNPPDPQHYCEQYCLETPTPFALGGDALLSAYCFWFNKQ